MRLKCPFCGDATSDNGYDFKIHLRMEHDFIPFPFMDYDYPTLYGCDCCGERFAADTLTKHFENLQKSGELLNHLVPAAARALFGDKNPKRRATPRKTMQ